MIAILINREKERREMEESYIKKWLIENQPPTTNKETIELLRINDQISSDDEQMYGFTIDQGSKETIEETYARFDKEWVIDNGDQESDEDYVPKVNKRKREQDDEEYKETKKRKLEIEETNEELIIFEDDETPLTQPYDDDDVEMEDIDDEPSTTEEVSVRLKKIILSNDAHIKPENRNKQIWPKKKPICRK